MKRSDFRHLERLRVRWAEVDLQKIVFNGHYLMYVDTAVAGYWRALAMPYHETMEQLQGDLYVRKVTLEYLGSARYDEQLVVAIRCGRIGNSSLQFQTGIFRGEQLLVHGELVYVFADPATQTSKPVPPALRELFTAYEAGESVAEVRLGNWAELGPAARVLRHQVFAAEQGIAADLMSDAADEDAVHALAFNRFGLPLASGCLLQAAPGVAKIGRMATAASVRGAGLGASVLRALMEQARARGDHEVMVHAQTSANGFYLRAGFTPHGDVFHEAGVPHQEMRRML
ncbi:MAG: YbgC/FadM family acyl-CoA thioesterase [Rubrivivax sp.]|nr:YbgC/FadM family acyl-CoA thioesterase [Rubrivivax sp.]